ncbi:MAG: hypothetical protein J6U12_06390 [Candidatus Methanomethylophilaceae archaeon]|nr:hypothetical protein [Candidatus Methanomethylophilaceae archaeon]MBP5686118.1 hypothetical protein [Candidatus Methanomethylophilaceae archaeon]MBP5735795.1 hypothetical protein [Candidatus Methanomethylophilaceae archaeon]
MESRTITTILAVVVVVELILAGAVIAVFLNNSEDDSGEEIYTLYVGLNDSVTHEDYDPDYAADIVDNIVVKYAYGFTRYLANGGWTEDGGLIYEKSLVYVIEGIDLEKAHGIAGEAKKALNQSSILITTAKEKVEYY